MQNVKFSCLQMNTFVSTRSLKDHLDGSTIQTPFNFNSPFSTIDNFVKCGS